MSREKQFEERRDLSEIIFWSGYGFDRGTCNDIASQIQEQGYRKIPEGAIILTKEEIAALNEYQLKHFIGSEPNEE